MSKVSRTVNRRTKRKEKKSPGGGKETGVKLRVGDPGGFPRPSEVNRIVKSKKKKECNERTELPTLQNDRMRTRASCTDRERPLGVKR